MALASCSGFCKSKLLPQWIAAFGVVLLIMQFGAMWAWPSPYLARLTQPDSPIFLTLEQASWVASLLNIGRIVGTVIGSLCVHFWGSKNTILLTLIPITLSWAVIILANSPLMLYVARAAGGLGIGMAFCCFPLYIGEVAAPEIRGAIITLAFCGSPFGNVAASITGYYVSVWMSGVVFLVPCLLDIGLFAWLPDSPHHLVKVGKLENAKSAIHWYKNGVKVDEEFEAVQKFASSPDSASFKEKLLELKSPPTRRALFIVTTLFVLMQICGLNSVMTYMEMILRESESNLIDPSLAVILVNLIGAVTAVLSVKLMDKCGRRVLLMISGTGIPVSMIALGTHFTLMDKGYDPLKYQWLPLCSTFFFMISFVSGLMSVPSAVLGEIFPANVKCVAALIVNFIGAVVAFGSSKSYQPLVDTIGEAYVFYLHALLTGTFVPLVLCFLPETKGKTLQEIQDILAKKSVVDKC